MQQIERFRKRLSNTQSNEFRMTTDEARALLRDIDALSKPPKETPKPKVDKVQARQVSAYILDGGGFTS